MTGVTKSRQPAVPGRWAESGPLAALRNEMDDLFASFFGSALPAPLADVSVPSIDLAETDDAIEVKTDVPGMSANDISIEVRNDYLTISGETSEEQKSEENGERKYHRIERRTGKFSRAVKLPCDVEPDRVEAELKDGVLTVTLPKAEAMKAKKITIKG